MNPTLPPPSPCGKVSGTRPFGALPAIVPISAFSLRRRPDERLAGFCPPRGTGEIWACFLDGGGYLCHMVWIILLLCLGLAGLSAYHRGPICAGFSLMGLLIGLLLARPLSPLTGRLLPLLDLQNPLWQFFLPGVIAFVAVLVVFKMAGNYLHQRVSLHFKYQKDEHLYFRWERLYARLGFCVGLLNGAVYFFILMMPVYIGGYFLSEAGAVGAPGGAGFVTNLRSELHDSNLDRVLAAHDPVPAEIYQAGDIIDLVLHNPPVQPRLALYPPFLTLGRQKEIQDLANDAQLQKMVQSQAGIRDFLDNPKVQALLTNSAVTGQIWSLIGPNLPDLQEYLITGKSPKFDPEKILGVWDLDLRATWAEERKANPNMTARQVAGLRVTFLPVVRDLRLTATTDNQMILERWSAKGAQPTDANLGTWKNAGDNYEIALGRNPPDTVAVTAGDDGALSLRLHWRGHLCVFNKEM